ncbi:MAG: hypothetical protein ACE14M_04485 [Terriglobales bacterium]
MADEKEKEAARKPEETDPHRRRSKVPHWVLPLGAFVVGVGGALTWVLRGCWHTHMGWPIREGEYSYQVCTQCGIKRLFDEKAFQPYGPYGYDLHELIARSRAAHIKQIHEAVTKSPKVAGRK